MKIHTDFSQGSVSWLFARAGVVTASEFDNIISPEWKPRTGETPRTYMAMKLAERWIQGPLEGFSAFATDQGKVLEDEARPWYELDQEREVTRVGFITSDDGKIGCSPDGLIGTDGGIEIKCPEPTAHVKYLLAGDVPKAYLAQVHGSMLVTGRPWWEFLSYNRRFPKLLIRVNRDEEIQNKLRDALEGFLEEFELAWLRLVEKNGGPPKVRAKFVPSVPSEDNPYVEIGSDYRV